MPRSGEDARRRLTAAALELYSQQGFEKTTTAEIAARAGVTERTFFRHFPDKREVVFDGQAALMARLAEGVAAAPPHLAPLETLAFAFRSAEALFVAGRSAAMEHRILFETTPALRERSLTKSAALIKSLAEALELRGVEVPLAILAAHAGMAAMSLAISGWHADPSRSFSAYIDRSFDQLRNLSTG